ncbi:hypothetical protein EB118_23850, partial [bacterium]|nr:hypothetical protein [bacterium]
EQIESTEEIKQEKKQVKQEEKRKQKQLEEAKKVAEASQQVLPTSTGAAVPVEMPVAKETEAEALKADTLKFFKKNEDNKYEGEHGDVGEVPVYKSRSKLVYLPIRTFLDLAEPIDTTKQNINLFTGEEKSTTVAKVLKESGKFKSIPSLTIEDNNDGTYKVTGHEGRHRANALLQLGYTHIPVEVRASDIRWSEQNNPDNFDYKQNWPTKLISQDGKQSVPFPVSREESSTEARVSEAKKEPTAETPTIPSTPTTLDPEVAKQVEAIRNQIIRRDEKGTIEPAGMNVDVVEKLVEQIVAKWKNAPVIDVVDKVSDLPKRLRIGSELQPGLFDPVIGRVFIIASNLDSEIELYNTILHETIGHYGLRSLLGDKYKSTMLNLYNSNKRVKGYVDEEMELNPKLTKEVAVEEFLAAVAERNLVPKPNPLDKVLGKKIIQFVRNLLRRIFGERVDTLTDKDFLGLVADARALVQEGAPTGKYRNVSEYEGPLYRKGKVLTAPIVPDQTFEEALESSGARIKQPTPLWKRLMSKGGRQD